MPEQNTQEVDNGTQAATAEKTFTQSEMDAILGDRLKRERAKYADYGELKAKAEKYDAAEEANKSELEKAVEERDKYKAKVEELENEKARAAAVAEAARKHGVDAELLSRMAGDVEENAAFLKAQMDGAQKHGSVPDFGEASAPTVTKESIEAIKDPVERIRARAQHQNLFK